MQFWALSKTSNFHNRELILVSNQRRKVLVCIMEKKRRNDFFNVLCFDIAEVIGVMFSVNSGGAGWPSGYDYACLWIWRSEERSPAAGSFKLFKILYFWWDFRWRSWINRLDIGILDWFNRMSVRLTDWLMTDRQIMRYGDR